MKRLLIYFGLFICLCEYSHGQSSCSALAPYTYSDGIYNFQHAESELISSYNLSRANYWTVFDRSYFISVQIDYYTTSNDLLFSWSTGCKDPYADDALSTINSFCYTDTVKEVITLDVWRNTLDSCTASIFGHTSKTHLIENPLANGKLYNCPNNLDTIVCPLPEHDTFYISYAINRFIDYKIGSFYKIMQCAPHPMPCHMLYYPETNFCVEDSIHINFTTPIFDSCVKIYKQYNDNEPILVSDTNVLYNVTKIRNVIVDDDAYCQYSYGNNRSQYNYYQLNDIADTISDPSFSDNNKFTKITYYVCIPTVCGLDSFYTLSQSIMVHKPLKFIPYELYHNCMGDSSGMIAFNTSSRYGGYILDNFSVAFGHCSGHSDSTCITKFCDSSFLNKTDLLSYTLYRDNIFNGTYDELCYDFYSQGNLCGICDNDTIVNLTEGDYKIIIRPEKSTCSIADSLCCQTKSNCTGDDPISFTFTIRKYNYAKPLGPDRILCQDSTVILKIPQKFTASPASAVWGNAYCSPNPLSITQLNDSMREVKNEGGSYHTVTIKTVEGCLIKDTVIVADLKPVTKNYRLPTALATSATQYSSGWSPQFSTIQWADSQSLAGFAQANIYYTGSAGVFRPVKSSDYSDTLNSSANLFGAYADASPVSQLKDVYIRNTGNIIDYKFFNYGNPLFSDCVPQWVLNNTMTKYSPSGYDIENKDILDIYSAALYAYKDKLPIAVCSNAKENEIGFEGFEEYSTNSEDENYFNTKTQLNNSTGNFDIIRQTKALFMPKSKDYEIVRAFNRYAMIKGNICSVCDEPFVCTITAQSVPYDYATEKITDIKVTSYQTMALASPCGDSSFTILQLDENLPSDMPAFRCRFWAGTASVQSKRYVPKLGEFNIELDNTIAHTGKYSLKLPDNERIIIPQVDLELQPKKTYHIGAWIHKASMSSESPESLKYSNADDSIGILVILPTNEKIFLVPGGEVIAGWQRLEGTFTMPVGIRTEIQLGFVGKVEFNIDDIRIYPQNSAIQTYIYDPSNYKVRAVLDQNNYATMYQYDDEGNLFLLKKETIKGIKTIQASNSHIKSSRP